MSLFNVFETKNNSSLPSLISTMDENMFSNAASLKLFKGTLADWNKGKTYHFVTGGQWSLHELVGFVLTKTGPANVWLSTWAITENPARAFLSWKESGLISNLYGIFDYKIKEQKSATFNLCENFFTKIHLTKCHAKVVVIRNNEWGVSISTSANLTRNPRIERGIICVSETVADSDINWMNAIMSNEKYFKVNRHAES